MNIILTYINKFIQNKSVRISFLFWLGSMTANVANWLFNLLAGRALTKEEFAILTVFLSLGSIINVPANAIATTVSRYTAYKIGDKTDSSYYFFLKHYSLISWIMGVTVMGIFLFSAGAIKDFFALPTTYHIYLFAPTILLLFLTAFQRGVLKGHLLLVWVGLLMATEALIKVSSVLLVNFFSVPHLPFVISSLPISVLVTLIVSIMVTKDKRPEQNEKKEKYSFTETYGFFTNSFIASIGMVLLNSIDMLLVKHYFDASTAGTYAILTLFGRILFFGGGGLIELFVPFVARANGQGQSGIKQFIALVMAVGSIAGGTLLAFLIFPEFVVRVFIGEKALSVLPYLATYSIGVFFLILVSCLNVFNIAKKDFIPSRIIIGAVVLETLAIIFNHNSLSQIISILATTNIILFVIICLYSFFSKGKKRASSTNAQSQNPIFLVSLMVGAIFGKKRKVIIKAPENIDDYTLIRTIETPGLKRPHVIAVYKNKTGKEAVAKIWQGVTKNFDYYALKNEAHMYQLISRVAKKNKVPSSYADVRIPTLLKIIDENNTLILLTEFVKGEVAADKANLNKIEIYNKCVQYLRYIGENFTEEEKETVSTRTIKDYVLLFPLLFGVSLLRRPFLAIPLLKGAIVFLQSLPQLLIQKKLVLTHRDLHFHNIIISKKEIYVLDLQRCIFTYPLYEYATTLPIEWNDEKFRNQLLELSTSESQRETGSSTLLKGLLANFSIHGLTANNLPETNIQRFIKMLYYSI